MKLSPFQGMIDQSMLTNKLLGTMNTNMANFISEMRNVSSAPIREINQEIEKTPQKIGMAEQDILNLVEKLKEAEAQCRAMGDTTQANKLKEMLKMINVETTDVKGSMNELRQYIEKTFGTDALKQFDKELKNIDKTTKNVGKKSNFGSNLKTALGIGTVALGIRKGWNFLKSSTNESVDFVEQQNLFNVSMGKTVDQYGNLDREASKYYTKAISFQEKLEEKLGINIAESMQYQALFNAMSKSMGISADYAYKLSENFTKLGYDLSSLYNIDPENAMQKLRAGLSGQTKPLRDLGLDITQQSLEPLLDELGIERSVKQLSQAEKMVARYIVVLRQASLAHGDFAKTMDSPANQLKIFNAQITAFKRNMGNLWQGMLGGILPYVNAIMMVINELLKMVAKLFGFKVETQNISASVGADDLASDLGTATGKAKELKKQLMGFDEINNITLPDKSSSGSGASVGGIDQRLLDAMKEYDNLMDKVKNKATDIRDKMMAWLGFHRTEDGWKLDEGLTNAEKILDVMKAIGVAIGTWKVSKAITNLMNNLGIMNKTDAFRLAFGLTLTLTGIFAQYKGTKHLLDGNMDLFTILETVLGTAGGAFGIATILKATNIGKKMSIGKRLQIGLGIMLVIQGIQVVVNGIKEKDLKNQLLGALEIGAGAFSIANSIGGLKFGMQAGLVVTLATIDIVLLTDIITWWNEYFEKWKKELYADKKELNFWEMVHVGLTGVGEGFAETITNWTSKITEAKGITKISREELNNLKKEVQDTTKSYEEFKETLDKKIESSDSEIAISQKLAQELNGLVDGNGKVKKGYEARVDFILKELNSSFDMELKRDGEIITKNGEIVNSNTELQNSIEETIKKRRKELELEVSQELYKEALKQKIQIQNQLNKAVEKQKEAQEEYNKALKEGVDPGTYLVLQENLNIATNSVNELSEKYKECSRDVIEADQNMTNSMIENSGVVTAEMINQGQVSMETLVNIAKNNTEKWEESYQNLDEDTKRAMLEMSTTINDNSPKVIEKWKELSQGSYEEFKKYMDETDEKNIATVLSILTETEGMTPNIQQAWVDLSRTSAEAYNQGIEKLPEETRAKILASTIAVTGMTETTKTAYNNLSEEGKKAFNTAMSSLNIDARNKVQSAIDEINAKQVQAGNAGRDVGNSANRNFNTGLGDTTQSGTNFITGFARVLSGGNPGGLFGVNGIISSLTSKIIRKWKEGLGEHSPSVLTKQSAIFFAQGFTDQLDKSSTEMLTQVKKLATGITDKFSDNIGINEIANGININPNDFKIDTNQFIDYGQISGAIATQSNVKVESNIEGRIENAIYRGLSNATIPVEIEATTDEGIIFKKVQTKAKEYTMQTGEPAFDF